MFSCRDKGNYLLSGMIDKVVHVMVNEYVSNCHEKNSILQPKINRWEVHINKTFIINTQLYL